MDINKEREAFESWIKKEYPEMLELISHSDVKQAYDFSWEVWQAAKAQVDQKVKLLLCDEHLKKCESPTGIFNSQYPDEEPCLICLAKEAKAQAVPEGFVLVSKDTLNKALNPNDYDEAVCSANELLAVIESQCPSSTPGCPDEP